MQFLQRPSTREVFPSEKNGQIIVMQVSRQWRVTVNGYDQSGPYADRMIRTVLGQVPSTVHPRRILLLGLGAGSGVRELWRRFPKAHITAIEYDPVMIDIAAQTFLKQPPADRLSILLGDAVRIVPALKEDFDLIFVDLFVGKTPEPKLETDAFVKTLVPRLRLDGYLLVNCFKRKGFIAPVFDRHFSRWENVKYKHNELSVYRQFGQGKVGDPAPFGFRDPRESRLCLTVLQQRGIFRRTIQEHGASCYFAKHIGPFSIEQVASDDEPDTRPSDRLRIMFWQPLSGRRVRGWWRNPFALPQLQVGIATVKPDYATHWSSHALRHLRAWRRDTTTEVVEATFEEFGEAFHASKHLHRSLRKAFLRGLKYSIDFDPKNVHCFVTREKATGTMTAGLAVIDYPDIAESIHMIAFIHPSARKSSVGVGLIDHWYAHALAHSIRFLNFGFVWKQGDPKEWQGYSRFKRQFALHLLWYPPPLVRFVFPKQWQQRLFFWKKEKKEETSARE